MWETCIENFAVSIDRYDFVKDKKKPIFHISNIFFLSRYVKFQSVGSPKKKYIDSKDLKLKKIVLRDRNLKNPEFKNLTGKTK